MSLPMFALRSNEYGTPQPLFDWLDRQFDFTVDVCSVPKLAKCRRYYTPLDDGLAQDWTGERAWMNPPYTDGIIAWVRKAWESARSIHTTVVALLPVRTDTEWFHLYVMRAEQVWFIKGRLQFEQGEGAGSGGMPVPSMIVVFRYTEDEPVFKTVEIPRKRRGIYNGLQGRLK